ncbi:leucyl aminopeptidase [Parvularcula sp. LCG005]|uniref:leucyl aminopeptidase n=1 Tax=Parvularcula sp. LCG005 TaxID=3078805 RepID=UPI0029439DE8|nr:leucyl aminopeptidase [Parvularcula sp. LCG005]WOI52291.1 leucyl aminopeptidase [Parvularcula sp. LCG005]
MKINFSSSLPQHGTIIVPVLQGGLSSPAVKLVDEQSKGALARGMKAANFKAKAGEKVMLAGPDGLDDAVVVLLGLGDGKGAVDAVALGGKALAAAGKGISHISVVSEGLTYAGKSGADLAGKIALGMMLRQYDFDIYRKKTAPKDAVALEGVTIVASDAEGATASLDEAKSIVAGVKVARDLVTEPPNVLYPESFADRCLELEKLGVEVTVLDVDAMTKLGMGCLLGVGQGSVKPSRLVAMHWKGGKDGEKPLALVGKGVTFDTGGISIKPAGGMEDMKFDMGGAAAVTGAMHAIAGRKAKANVVGLIGLVENMPSGNAQRPSDVVTSMSGQTVEVLNTDAEGRLVLADVLAYAQKTFEPSAIVDLATLTGAIIISLAHEFGGMFTKDDDFGADLMAAGEETGELLWRMPLTKAHDDMIKSDIADMKNIGGREGGSSTAAAFLARFVDDNVKWAHLDIAGMAWTTKDQDVCPKGATGYGVRLLDALVRRSFER